MVRLLMENAKHDLKRLTSLGNWVVLAMGVILVLLKTRMFAYGFFVGGFLAMANLGILGASLIPFMQTGRGQKRAVFGALGGFFGLCLSVFVMVRFAHSMLLGFACGLAVPALVGPLFSRFLRGSNNP